MTYSTKVSACVNDCNDTQLDSLDDFLKLAFHSLLISRHNWKGYISTICLNSLFTLAFLNTFIIGS